MWLASWRHAAIATHQSSICAYRKNPIGALLLVAAHCFCWKVAVPRHMLRREIQNRCAHRSLRNDRNHTRPRTVRRVSVAKWMWINLRLLTGEAQLSPDNELQNVGVGQQTALSWVVRKRDGEGLVVVRCCGCPQSKRD